MSHEFHAYDGTGHAFQDSHTPNYREAAANDARPKMLAFLRRELRPPTVTRIDDAQLPQFAARASLISAGRDFEPVFFMMAARWFSIVR